MMGHRGNTDTSQLLAHGLCGLRRGHGNGDPGGVCGLQSPVPRPSLPPFPRPISFRRGLQTLRTTPFQPALRGPAPFRFARGKPFHFSAKASNSYAGKSGTGAYSGDGGLAAAAILNGPAGVAIDQAGNLYIADGANNVVRKVTPAGYISTYAGTGTAGYSGDGSAATSAELSAPWGLAFDASGNLYIGDTGNNRVRKVTPRDYFHLRGDRCRRVLR